MNLIDVHCHLTHDYFKDKLDAVLKRAEKAGLKAIIVSGVNPEANLEVLALAKKHPKLIKASLGIYPIDALGIQPDGAGMTRHKGPIDLEKEFKFIEQNQDAVHCIGEVGMDFHWADKEKTYQQQAENFRKIICFAIRIKKPLVIHSRKAEEECLQILEEEIKNKEIPVIQHCFSGRKSLMSKGVELGHYFSIPPCIVKSSNFQTLVKKVPLTQLLTETDSPWLSPYKEGMNEPAFVVESIKQIALVKELSEEEVADQIWKNYQKTFGK
ncbi:MAG TPA: TatD family hydrolase [Candidatus Nanoarchaeia archaeon]|nr:TatD family hydrolase [Candidatus Nanoarchaeia archaeon]